MTMKKAKQFVALFFVAAMMTLAGCEKENVNNNSEPQPQPRPAGISLAGTSWECEIDTSYSSDGFVQLMNVHQIIDFNDDVNGELFIDFTAEFPDYPQSTQHETMTLQFTYYFYNNTMTLTSTDDDAVEGDSGTMIYHPEDTTFHMIVDDAYTAEILGDEMIFRLTRGSIDF